MLQSAVVQSGNKLGLEGPSAWVGVLALLLISCVTLGKLLHLSVTPFPHLKNGDDNAI